MISDVVKPTTKDAIAGLKKNGIKKTIMLTGDANETAQRVAAEIGIDEVHSELLPADKVAQVEHILNAKGEKENLAFVGDGINDAPVLSRADIGIAMGAMGSGCSDRGSRCGPYGRCTSGKDRAGYGDLCTNLKDRAGKHCLCTCG